MTRAFAWNACCARISSTNWLERSTLEISRAPDCKEPVPLLPGPATIGWPERIVSLKRFFPTGLRPAVLANLGNRTRSRSTARPVRKQPADLTLLINAEALQDA